MQIEVHIVNAFIDGGTGGNPAGVVLDASGLTSVQKQEIARQVGSSETAFISASDTATIKLDFFTPARQIAHCGHATIATFCLLRQLGSIGDGRLSKETIDGNRAIVVEGDMAYMEQLAPKYSQIAPASAMGSRVLASLGIDQAHLLSGVNPCVVNTGNSFLVVALPNERTVAGLRPRLDRVESISNDLDLIGYYVFSTTTKIPGRHAGTRMFAPRYGIAEESATGTAAGPLGCFLHDHLGVTDREIWIEQGRLMQPPFQSVIKVVLELAAGKIERLMVGGKARVVSSVRVAV